jgi:WD40 repeat protein
MLPVRYFLLLCLVVLVGKAAAQGEAGDRKGGDRKPVPQLEPEVEPSTEGVAVRFGSTRFWHRGSIGAIAVSPDGELVATGESSGPWKPAADGGFQADGNQNRIRVWDARTGQQLHAVGAEGIVVDGLAFSPDGRRLAVGSFGETWLFEVSASGKLQRRKTIEEAMGTVRFCSDGKTLVTESVWGPQSWDVHTGKRIRKWEYPEKRKPLPGGER